MIKSRLSWYKQNKLIALFIAGEATTARIASVLVNVNKTTASYYFQRLRELIHDNCEHLQMLEGEIDVDESYFAGVIKVKRRCRAAGKIPVFGLLKCNGLAYTVIIPNAQSDTLIPII